MEDGAIIVVRLLSIPCSGKGVLVPWKRGQSLGTVVVLGAVLAILRTFVT